MIKYKANPNLYDIYHKYIPSKSIWNFLQLPDQIMNRPEKKIFYSDLEEDILKNGYRNPILVMAIQPYPQELLNKKLTKNSFWRTCIKLHDFFWTNDEDNPIWLPRHRIPREIMDENKTLLICRMLGGSRLWVAQKNDLEVPCIVSDFCGKFEGEKLKTKEEILSCFKDDFKMEYTSFGISH
jgi:hypothetical protein